MRVTSPPAGATPHADEHRISTTGYRD
ncbi:hypothetical protein A2U01_0064686, partial [Trifolium medium]|nr:hypothetical protein [Trifolium medium]